VLEIDVDIGRLLTLLGDEAIEQQLVLGRIDRGDAEDVAHCRICSAPPPLAQDWRIAPPREVDDVLDGEKIARQIKLGDQRQFAHQCGSDGFGQAVRVAPPCPFPDFAFEESLRGLAIRVDFLGVFVPQFIKAEIAAVRHLSRGGNCVGPAGEEALHLHRAFQMPLGIGVEQVAGGGDGGLVPDRGHHILQGATLGHVVVDVIGGEEAETMGARKCVKALDPGDIVPAIEVARR